jgi:uncharacterized protein
MTSSVVTGSSQAQPSKVLQLSPLHIEMVQRILHKHVPNGHVFAFGSRVNGRPARYSDLDLAVSLPQPLTLRTLRQLKDAFEDSDLPVCVDIVDWSEADERFKASILASGTAILQDQDVQF